MFKKNNKKNKPTNGESFVLMFLILVEMFWQMQISEKKLK